MITIKTINGKEVEFENVAKVFDTDRKTRNEYFGKYVAEVSAVYPLKLDAVAAKIKELEKEYNNYLTNLKALGEAVAVEKKEADAKKLAAQVNDMTPEQLEALKAAIEAKENKQQN
nr:MAG TPA: hypothetical protein [Caudoviricetes sp.]